MLTLKQASELYDIPASRIRRRLKVAGFSKTGRDWIVTEEMVKKCITEYKLSPEGKKKRELRRNLKEIHESSEHPEVTSLRIIATLVGYIDDFEIGEWSIGEFGEDKDEQTEN